jgi:quercetin dioxygenase-like cupin family protein
MSTEDMPQGLDRAFTQLGDHEEYDWVPLPEEEFEGVYNKVMYFNRVSGEVFELVKIEEGAEFPAHYHPTLQTLYLTEGKLRHPDGSVTEPGRFEMIPAGEKHGNYVAEETAIQHKYFSGTPMFFLPDGSSYVYRDDGRIIDSGEVDMDGRLESENFLR